MYSHESFSLPCSLKVPRVENYLRTLALILSIEEMKESLLAGAASIITINEQVPRHYLFLLKMNLPFFIYLCTFLSTFFIIPPHAAHTGARQCAPQSFLPCGAQSW